MNCKNKEKGKSNRLEKNEEWNWMRIREYSNREG